MIVVYNLDTKAIEVTEDNVIIPTLPLNLSMEEKKQSYKEKNQGIIALPYELGSAIFNYNLCFDSSNNFIELQPKEGI